jgi:hypothetical protein
MFLLDPTVLVILPNLSKSEILALFLDNLTRYRHGKPLGNVVDKKMLVTNNDYLQFHWQSLLSKSDRFHRLSLTNRIPPLLYSGKFSR